ncbi:glycoside hydrolase [Saitoella complicata NRRL Y-17804]|nr:glycoside hydrolase [Saitoella complicata NRRL Y-17804]ODQ50071.1 glycoside hydrolase [Saitoella complicata NRRL Y-17804]
MRLFTLFLFLFTLASSITLAAAEDFQWSDNEVVSPAPRTSHLHHRSLTKRACSNLLIDNFSSQSQLDNRKNDLGYKTSADGTASISISSSSSSKLVITPSSSSSYFYSNTKCQSISGYSAVQFSIAGPSGASVKVAVRYFDSATSCAPYGTSGYKTAYYTVTGLSSTAKRVTIPFSSLGITPAGSVISSVYLENFSVTGRSYSLWQLALTCSSTSTSTGKTATCTSSSSGSYGLIDDFSATKSTNDLNYATGDDSTCKSVTVLASSNKIQIVPASTSSSYWYSDVGCQALTKFSGVQLSVAGPSGASVQVVVSYYPSSSSCSTGTGVQTATYTVSGLSSTAKRISIPFSTLGIDSNSAVLASIRLKNFSSKGTFYLWKLAFTCPSSSASTTSVANLGGSTAAAVAQTTTSSAATSYTTYTASNVNVLRDAQLDGSIRAVGVNLGGILQYENWLSSGSPVQALLNELDDGSYYAEKGELVIMRAFPNNRSAMVTAFQQHRAVLTEADFKLMAQYGINSVRVPINWGIMPVNSGGGDPDEWADFATGSLSVLDKIVNTWAPKYGITVLLSMHGHKGTHGVAEHASPGAANPVVYWDQYTENQQNSVNVAVYLAKRYLSSPAFLGIGMMNEPVNVAESVVRQYFLDAYAAVRAVSNCLLVFAPMLWQQYPSNGWQNFLSPNDGYYNVREEWHPYFCFPPDWSSANNSAQILSYTANELQNDWNGAPGVGKMATEWSLATPNAMSSSDLTQFAKNQMKAYDYGGGFYFWTWKFWADNNNDNYINGWSLKSLLTHGVITKAMMQAAW